MSDWTDTPPTKAGTYWVRRREGQAESVSRFDPIDTDEFQWFDPVAKEWCSTQAMLAGYQFGHRIPTNDELAELPGLIERLRECVWEQADYTRRGIDREAKRWAKQASEIQDKINAILGVHKLP